MRPILRYVLLAGTLTCSLHAEEPAKPVTVAVVEKSPLISRVELTGSVTARRHSRLSARTAGLIATLRPDAGDVVKQGDVLVELDDELAALALERVQAEREQAVLEVAEAQRLVDEVRGLARSGAFTRSEAQTRETSLKLKSAILRQAEVQQREQAALVERHRLLAPFDGVISRKLAEEGEWVQTGTPVLELVETGNLRMDVQGPQELFARLKETPEVGVRLDVDPERVLSGKIAVAVPVKDAVTRTFLIRIAMEDPDQLAAPGISGRAVFSFTGDQPVVQVPRDAVVRFADGSAKVWKVVDEGVGTVVRSQVITLGPALTDQLEVLTGLEAGVRVVERGNEGLREGQAVQIFTPTSGKE